MKKWHWRTLAVGAALAGLTLVSFASGFVTVYNGLNAGIVVGSPGHSCGFEWKGVVGPFCN
jgi:hypothetical protein